MGKTHRGTREFREISESPNPRISVKNEFTIKIILYYNIILFYITISINKALIGDSEIRRFGDFEGMLV